MEAEVRKVCDKPTQGMTPGRSEARRPVHYPPSTPNYQAQMTRIDNRDNHDVVADETRAL
jgi:hypothetical protein